MANHAPPRKGKNKYIIRHNVGVDNPDLPKGIFDFNRGEFVFSSDSPSYRFQASFDDGAPLPTDDSYGGWTVVPIPNRMGLVEWDGRNPLGLEISFVIDRTNDEADEDPGRWCQTMFEQLEKLAGLHSMKEEPPLFVFNSNGLCPHDFIYNRRWRWVIESLSWDKDRFINNFYNRPVFIAGTVTIRQFNDDDLMDAYEGPAKKNRNHHKKDKKDRGNSKYTVKQGDTLQKIASKKLGDPKRWRDIADLNDIRHPSNDEKLKPGTVLKVPSK
jgi:hypothetical protein